MTNGTKMKYARHPDDPLTLKELEIWHSQECEISSCPSRKGRRGKTWKETMSELHVTNSTISNTKNKKEYNALAQAMLESKNHGIEQYIEDLIALTKAKKPVIIKGATGEASTVSNEPENTVRFNATSEIGDIFGAKAPKQVDLKHSMAAMSDEELRREVDNSVKEISENGRIQHKITGAFDARAIVKNTVACEESAMAVSAGEQTACSADS